MDPFARKMWRAGLGFAALMLSLLAALYVVYAHERPTCPDRVIGETDSPTHQWTAAILERRCGAEAPFITRVNLRPSGPLQRGFFTGHVDNGTVFIIEQDAAGAGITLLWSANDELTIRCAHCSASYVRQRDPAWRSVRIQYVFSGA
jgi:hypothetical protein